MVYMGNVGDGVLVWAMLLLLANIMVTQRTST